MRPGLPFEMLEALKFVLATTSTWTCLHTTYIQCADLVYQVCVVHPVLTCKVTPSAQSSVHEALSIKRCPNCCLCRPLLAVPHILADEASAYCHAYVLAEMAVHQARLCLIGFMLACRPLLAVPHILADESSAYYHAYVLAEMAVHQARLAGLPRWRCLVSAAREPCTLLL